MEALLLLWRRRVYRGRLSAAARAVHLGEEHRQPGEDPARDQRGAAAGRGGEDLPPALKVLLESRSTVHV